MTRRRLAIVPVMAGNELRWQLIHVGWFRVRVLAESRKAEDVVEATKRICEVLS
jgi:hypothetical protein